MHMPDGKLAELSDLAQQALAWLASQQIQPDPVNYAVAWAYFGGEMPDLNAEINRMKAQGKAIDGRYLYELHQRYLAAVPDYDMGRIGHELNAMLQGLLQCLVEAGSEMSEFGLSIGRQIERMEHDPSPDVFEAVARELMVATYAAQARNQTLHQRLEETRRETDRLREELEVSRREVFIDSLTGLSNRRALDKRLEELLVDPGCETLGMLVADIDHFKAINDTYGHAIGDVVIRNVAEVLRRTVRGDDVAARFGGEEFVVLLPNTPLAGAIKVAETIRSRIEQLRLVRKHDNFHLEPFTISVGVAMLQANETAENLFDRADALMYQAKREGRNRVIGEAG